MTRTPRGPLAAFMRIPANDRAVGRALVTCRRPRSSWRCTSVPSGGAVDNADPWLAYSHSTCARWRGPVLAALARWPGERGHVVVYHWARGGWRGPAVVPGVRPDPADGPKIVASGHALYVAWRSFTGSDHYLSALEGCHWSTPTILPGGHNHPRLAAAPREQAAFVSTLQGGVMTFHLVAGRRPSGFGVVGAAGQPFRSGPDGVEGDLGRSLVYGHAYHLLARDVRNRLALTESAHGRLWSLPVVLARHDGFEPALAWDEQCSTLVIGYEQWKHGQFQLEVRLERNGAIGPARTVATSSPVSPRGRERRFGDYIAATAEGGHAVIAYQQATGHGSHIAAATLGYPCPTTT